MVAPKKHNRLYGARDAMQKLLISFHLKVKLYPNANNGQAKEHRARPCKDNSGVIITKYLEQKLKQVWKNFTITDFFFVSTTSG